MRYRGSPGASKRALPGERRGKGVSAEGGKGATSIQQRLTSSLVEHEINRASKITAIVSESALRSYRKASSSSPEVDVHEIDIRTLVHNCLSSRNELRSLGPADLNTEVLLRLVPLGESPFGASSLKEGGSEAHLRAGDVGTEGDAESSEGEVSWSETKDVSKKKVNI